MASGTIKLKYCYGFILNHGNLTSDIELAAPMLYPAASDLGMPTALLNDRQGLRNEKKVLPPS